MENLNKLLDLTEDTIGDLASWSADNHDLFIEEIVELKEKLDAIRDQQWKIGVVK